ncbi:hypothetical protein PanWU01x14_325150, partial [Parasponia andersonii]
RRGAQDSGSFSRTSSTMAPPFFCPTSWRCKDSAAALPSSRFWQFVQRRDTSTCSSAFWPVLT